MIHEALDRELEARLRVTLDEMIPKLIVPAPSQQHAWHPATNEVVVRSSSPAKRSYRRVAAVGMAAATAAVGFAIINNRPALDVSAPSDSAPVAGSEPNWYPLLRPHVPERFGYLAITNSTEDSASFVAIDVDDGKALEIVLAPTERYTDPAGTGDSVGSWIDTPQGWVVNTPAGLRVEVSCDIGARGRDFTGPPNYCDMASTGAFTKTEIRSVAAAVATEPAIEAAHGLALVTPAPQSGIRDLIAASLSDQQLIGDTEWGSGDHVWDFAAAGQARPGTSVRIIAGIYPRPTHRLGPVGGLYDDAAALWVVDSNGVAVRVSTTDPRPASYFSMQALATGIADQALVDNPASSEASPTTSSTSRPTPTSVVQTQTRLLVANASSTDGAARALTNDLADDYGVLPAVSAALSLERTIVYFAPSYQEQAAQLAERLGGADVARLPDSLPIEGGNDGLGGPRIVDPAAVVDLLVLLGNDHSTQSANTLDQDPPTTTTKPT